jgi:hypothetical protein
MEALIFVGNKKSSLDRETGLSASWAWSDEHATDYFSTQPEGPTMVKKAAVIIQIVIVSLIIIYGTVSLYMGNFEGMFATFPFLLFYYVYVVARQNRKRRFEEREEDER